MAQNVLVITAQISAVDENINNNNCGLIWYRLVSPLLPNMSWNFKAHNFKDTPTVNVQVTLNNNTLIEGEGWKLEVLIIPCCDSDIGCSECSNLSPQPYPTTIPPTAYHNYIDIDPQNVGNAVSSIGFKRYVLSSNVISRKQYVRIQGELKCILGEDQNCSSKEIDTNITTGDTAFDLVIYGKNLVFNDNDNQPITPEVYNYNDGDCYFNRYVYLIKKQDFNCIYCLLSRQYRMLC